MKTKHLSMLAVAAGIRITAGCGSSEPSENGNRASGLEGGSNTGGNPSSAGTSGGAGTASGQGGAAGNGGLGGGGGAGGVAGAGGGAAGNSAGAGGKGGGGGAGGGGNEMCTASKAVNTNASGTGPHKVTVETNAASGINQGTIFRPTDLGGAEKYPIFVWGEGACSLNGLSTSAAMSEIASHGYFVIADGTPNNGSSRAMTSDVVSMGKPLLDYVSWAVAENNKSCSAYHQALDTSKIASNGFSCGGLMAEGTAGDPRITTWGLNSSGLINANPAFYRTVHTPVLIVLGGTSDSAYKNGERDYASIGALGVPILLFSKNLGHGGDLFSRNGGDFTKIDLAWLNWRLKGDETATGKGLLVGSSCPYCKDGAWEVKSMNLQ